MKLSTKGRYGIKAMVDLAIHYCKGPVPIKAISERQNISELYLEQLFSSLRKANLVKSIRGSQGGYVLSKSPHEITIDEVMMVLEGPIEISECLEDTTSCSNIGNCSTRLLWAKIKDSIDDVLKSITLEDIVDDYKGIKHLKFEKDKTVYMDYSATTYVKSEVFKEMEPYFSEFYGNPSSIYSISRDTKAAIDKARLRVSRAIGADRDEIYFTSCGSESDNWALKGVAFANQNNGNHIITSTIEHHAVLNTCKFLEKHGFKITYLPVDKYGMINLKDLKDAITDKTILVSIMFANNEIGTLEPIKEIGQICKDANILFHTDAVQAIGNVPIDVKDMNIDLLSASAHKFYGPKGVGILYIKKGTQIDNLIHGGAQERGMRAGTENVSGIVGAGKAIEMVQENLLKHSNKLIKFRDRLINGLLKIPYSHLNGPIGDKRLPGNINVCFEFVEGESLLFSLDMHGICASGGSACASGSIEPSHVLLAIGVLPQIAHGSLRLTLGDGNTEQDVDYVLEVLPKVVKKLRDASPEWKEFLSKKGENKKI